MRQCGGDDVAAGPNAFYDACTGDCDFITMRSLVARFFKSQVQEAFTTPIKSLGGVNMLTYMEDRAIEATPANQAAMIPT